MHTRLALVLLLLLALGLALPGCCTCCTDPAHAPSEHPATDSCPDANLDRDDSIVTTLEGRGLFLERRPIANLAIERPVARMRLGGTWRTSGGAGEAFSVVSIQFFGSPGELTAQEVLDKQCRPFHVCTWPSPTWRSGPVEADWDGTSGAYTLAARVVYLHTKSGTTRRVFTLVRGVFRNIVKAPRSIGTMPTPPPSVVTTGDGSTLSNLIIAGTFDKNNHVAHYDVAFDYAYATPATSVEIFTTDSSNASNVFDPANRILDDTNVSGGHWATSQLTGPYNPPLSLIVGVQITYSNGTKELGRRVFLAPASIDDAIPLQ